MAKFLSVPTERTLGGVLSDTTVIVAALLLTETPGATITTLNCVPLSLSDSKPVEAPANFNELETIFMRYMGDIMSDASSPEEGLQGAHAELKAAMARLKSA